MSFEKNLVLRIRLLKRKLNSTKSSQLIILVKLLLQPTQKNALNSLIIAASTKNHKGVKNSCKAWVFENYVNRILSLNDNESLFECKSEKKEQKIL